MIFKFSKINVNDTCGFLKIKCFSFYRKYIYILNYGFFLASIKKTFKRYKKFLGVKKRNFLIKTKSNFNFKDNSNLNFLKNESVILKKRLSICGKFTKGPINYKIKKKKLLISFIFII